MGNPDDDPLARKPPADIADPEPWANWLRELRGWSRGTGAAPRARNRALEQVEQSRAARPADQAPEPEPEPEPEPPERDA